jgi:hypothetical protein
MDDPTSVRRSQCLGGPLAPGGNLCERLRYRDQLAEGIALHPFHHDGDSVVRSDHFIDGDNTWMIERGGGAGLADETCDYGRRAQAAGRDAFNRYVAVEIGIEGVIDLAHPAASNRGKDLETPLAVPEQLPVSSIRAGFARKKLGLIVRFRRRSYDECAC